MSSARHTASSATAFSLRWRSRADRRPYSRSADPPAEFGVDTRLTGGTEASGAGSTRAASAVATTGRAAHCRQNADFVSLSHSADDRAANAAPHRLHVE